MNEQDANGESWRKHDWLAASGLVILVFLFLGRAFLPGKVLLPLDVVTQLWSPWQQPGTAVTVHNPLVTDVIDYLYPVKAFVAAQMKQGQLPLWNPYVLGGYPLTYNTQAGLWYPLSVLYVLLPPVTAVDLTILLQMAFGGIFMFAYLRQLRLQRAAALLGAIVFLFNGVMVVWLEWQVVQAAVVWLPLYLYFVERAAQKLEIGDPIVRDAILAGFAFALPWLGGHWNWALYTSMTAAAYSLWRLGGIALAQRGGQQLAPRPKRKKLIGVALLILVVGVGVSLIQVLPAFVYISQGHRQPFTLAESLSLGLKNRAVVALVPDFFGTLVEGGTWWGPTNYNETAFYLGILPLFLAALAPFLRRDEVTWFYTLWGGLGLLWALGTPAYAPLWALPVFNGLWPSRAVMIVVFCAAVLSALALDKLMDTAVNWRRLWRVVIAVTAVMGGILLFYLWWYRPKWVDLRSELLWFGAALLAALVLLGARPRVTPGLFAFFAVLLVIVDLFWLGYDYNTIGDVADLYPETETARFLHNDPEPYRMTTWLKGVTYWPNTNLQHRLPSISGYEPSILQTWVDYLSAAEGGKVVHSLRLLLPDAGLESPLLDALNLKYLVTTSNWDQGDPPPGSAQKATATQPRLLHQDGETRIYLNDGYFPRAYVVPQALVAPDAAQALARVVENQDRLDEVVVLELAAPVEAYTPNGTGTAVITSYSPNRVSLRVDMHGPGYLVLADAYYPGWQATVDGEKTAVYRANSVVRAVYVPDGVHEVVFTFRPLDFYAGAAVTAVTLLVGMTLLVWPVMSRRWQADGPS
ncbi:MAG: YfhO family protein [Anaerolineae bacterium]|nr:YfhO family protein [Anaerolineae bacterium]